MKRRAAVGLGVSVFNVVMVGVLSGGAACDSKSGAKASSKVEYGEPVGIQIGAHGAVPALALGVAVSKGRDATPSVGSIATAIHAAALACPAFVAAMSAGKTVRLELGARAGAFEPLGASADEVGGACMSNALGGKPVTMDRPDPLDLIVELRLGKSDPQSPP